MKDNTQEKKDGPTVVGTVEERQEEVRLEYEQMDTWGHLLTKSMLMPLVLLMCGGFVLIILFFQIFGNSIREHVTDFFDSMSKYDWWLVIGMFLVACAAIWYACVKYVWSD